MSSLGGGGVDTGEELVKWEAEERRAETVPAEEFKYRAFFSYLSGLMREEAMGGGHGFEEEV